MFTHSMESLVYWAPIEGIRKEEIFELFSNLIESNVEENNWKINNDGLHLLVLIISKSYLSPTFIVIEFLI